MKLDERINEFLRDYGDPNQLMIIHYGGHGDEDVSAGRLAVWAALAEGGPTVDWSIIQPKLGHVHAHVLVLLDCCFAAQAVRASNRAIPSNVELMAASGMGVKTILPGPTSFTTRLIHLIEAELASNGFADISNISNLLAERNSGFRQTPNRFIGLEKTIRLEPLSQLVDESTGKLLDWLKAYPPGIVSRLTVEDVVQSTDELHQLLVDAGSESSVPRLERLQIPRKHDVLVAWNRFSKALPQFTRMLGCSPSISSDPQNEGVVQKQAKMEAQKILETLLDLEDAFVSLRRVVQLSVMGLPDLHSQKEVLREVFEDVPMKRNLGVPSSLEHCSNGHTSSPSDISKLHGHPSPSSAVHLAPVVGEGPKGKGKAVVTHSKDANEPLVRFEPISTSPYYSAPLDEKPLPQAPLDKEHQFSEDPKSTEMLALQLMPSVSSTREPWRTTSQSTSRVSAEQLSQDSTANLLVEAREGNVRIVRILLGLNANVEEIEPETGRTPLLIAARYRNFDVCRELLTSEHTKANIHAMDNHGRNVLHLALFDNGKENLIPLLLEHGAHFNAQDKDGKTPLHYCVELDKRDAARVLLWSHAAMELRNQMGDTPLELAIRRGRKELVKILLRNGAKIHDTDWRQVPRDILYEIEKHQKNLTNKPRTLRKH
ncbi:hypothetical protein G7Y79_00004g013250 [Physcia stellaris]|nr:hypothetical protein G7Y79_00004g013250 [Physcia stellaris]